MNRTSSETPGLRQLRPSLQWIFAFALLEGAFQCIPTRRHEQMQMAQYRLTGKHPFYSCGSFVPLFLNGSQSNRRSSMHALQQKLLEPLKLKQSERPREDLGQSRKRVDQKTFESRRKRQARLFLEEQNSKRQRECLRYQFQT